MIATLYRKIADHLTKWLGVVGAAIMAWGAWIDPMAVQSAAATYLGANPYRRVAFFLFLLVIFRGWYTGRKAKALAAKP